MKKVYIAIIFVMLFFNLIGINKVYAGTTSQYTQLTDGGGGSGSGTGGSSSDVQINPSDWDPSTSKTNDQELTKKAGKITALIRNIGIIVALIALMIIGIRMMFASVEEKSVIKKALPGYILGAIMVAAISTLPNLLLTISKGLWN